MHLRAPGPRWAGLLTQPSAPEDAQWRHLNLTTSSESNLNSSTVAGALKKAPVPYSVHQHKNPLQLSGDPDSMYMDHGESTLDGFGWQRFVQHACNSQYLNLIIT